MPPPSNASGDILRPQCLPLMRSVCSRRTAARGAYFLKQLLVAIDHGPFGEARLDDRSRFASHSCADDLVGEDCELGRECAGVPDGKEEAVSPGNDHLGGAADVGMD